MNNVHWQKIQKSEKFHTLNQSRKKYQENVSLTSSEFPQIWRQAADPAKMIEHGRYWSFFIWNYLDKGDQYCESPL